LTVSCALALPAVTVMCPVRAAPGLPATVYEIVAFPVPDVADEIVSHEASLAAVHVHPDTVVNAALNEAPMPPAACVVGSRAAVQVRPACVKLMSVVPAV